MVGTASPPYIYHGSIPVFCYGGGGAKFDHCTIGQLEFELETDGRGWISFPDNHNLFNSALNSVRSAAHNWGIFFSDLERLYLTPGQSQPRIVSA